MSVDAVSTDVRQTALPTRERLGLGFWLAAAWLATVIGLAILAPLLALPDPTRTLVGPRASGPTPAHLLGTDEAGRDLLSRVIWGARISLFVGTASIALGLIVGGTLGVVAGFYRGAADRVSGGVFDVLLAFPANVLLLLLLTFLGQEVVWVVLAIGVLAIAPFGRLARSNTLQFAHREFVTAARALGARGRWIIAREIVPNLVMPLGALALIGVALAIVVEGSLAFLGLGVEGSTPTWGEMIVEGSSGVSLRIAPQSALVPIAALFLTVLALNALGERLRAWVDVRPLLL